MLLLSPETLVAIPRLLLRSVMFRDAPLTRRAVDGLMCGHMDLRFDLGLGYGGPMEEAPYMEAVGKILAAAKKNDDKPVMSFAQGPAVEKLFRAGFRLLMAGADGMSLAAHMRTTLASAHETVAKVMKESKGVEGQ